MGTSEVKVYMCLGRRPISNGPEIAEVPTREVHKVALGPFVSSISHTQKGPRDASEAVLAGGPLRVHEAATRVRDLEWPS